MHDHEENETTNNNNLKRRKLQMNGVTVPEVTLLPSHISHNRQNDKVHVVRDEKRKIRWKNLQYWNGLSSLRVAANGRSVFCHDAQLSSHSR
jgi:hypothetical protein